MRAAIGKAQRCVRVLFDFSRGRQALLSVAQPALGAMLAARGFPDLRTTVLGLIAATAGFLSVFALNDLLDRDADRQGLPASLRSPPPPASPSLWPAHVISPALYHAPGAHHSRLTMFHSDKTATATVEKPVYDLDVAFLRHPLALGALSLSAGIIWVATLGLISVVTAYALEPLCALLFVACVGLETLYCSLKHKSWLKTIPAGMMVGLGGVAGWVAVAGMSWGALLFFLLLMIWEIAGRNLSNDLADLTSDAAVGIKTMATQYGPAVSARWIFVGALIIPFVAAFQAADFPLRILLVFGSIWSMTLPAFSLRKHPGEADAQRYFNRASLFPAMGLVMALVLMAL